jgi:hypothetical protein
MMGTGLSFSQQPGARMVSDPLAEIERRAGAAAKKGWR